MRGQGKLMGLVTLTVLLGLASAVGQELRSVGDRSSGPATPEVSKKIVARLRGLIADFRALGITRESAAAMDAPAASPLSFSGWT